MSILVLDIMDLLLHLVKYARHLRGIGVDGITADADINKAELRSKGGDVSRFQLDMTLSAALPFGRSSVSYDKDVPKTDDEKLVEVDGVVQKFYVGEDTERLAWCVIHALLGNAAGMLSPMLDYIILTMVGSEIFEELGKEESLPLSYTLDDSLTTAQAKGIHSLWCFMSTIRDKEKVRLGYERYNARASAASSGQGAGRAAAASAASHTFGFDQSSASATTRGALASHAPPISASSNSVFETPAVKEKIEAMQAMGFPREKCKWVVEQTGSETDLEAMIAWMLANGKFLYDAFREPYQSVGKVA